MMRKNSVVIGLGIPKIVQKALDAQNIQSSVDDKGDQVVKINLKGASSTQYASAISAVARALLKEACGADVGVVKRPEGEVTVDLSQSSVSNYPFTKIVSASGISFDGLPKDEGVAAIAELTYVRCLTKSFGMYYGIVSSFPPVLAGDNGDRLDFFVGGIVLISLANNQLKVFVKNVENLLGRMPSSSFVESTLPSRFREFSQTPEKFAANTVPDLLDDVTNAIVDYWADSQQNDRARAYVSFLMSHVGTELRKFVQFKCSQSASLFRMDKKDLEAFSLLLEDWTQSCGRLCRVDFGSAWGGIIFTDPQLERFRARIEQILHLRDLNDEISLLVDTQDQIALRTDNLWDAFDGIDVFDVSPATNQRWESCTNTCNRRLEPLEHMCADRLRMVLAARSAVAPQVIMNEFLRFRHIVKRPIVARELASERDILLARLSERLHSMKMEFEQRAASYEADSSNGASSSDERKYLTGRFLPPVVNKLVWLRQLRTRLGQMLKMRNMMLSDLARSEQFKNQCDVLRSDLEEHETETFRNWTYDIKDQQAQLTLDSSAPVLSMDKNGKIAVNYPERLVQLIREVRILTAMGYSVPAHIQNLSLAASKFYQAGVQLKQLAHTYNNIETDIIKSTKAMLLDAAVNFEKVVGASGVSKITWSNIAETDRFIERLRKAATLLLDDNRRLHRLHSQMGVLVVDLFKIDLLRYKERWMSKVRSIREKVLKSGFQNTEAWTRHWDIQIYKALEYQYRLGLESLHEVLPEVRAEVVFDKKSGRAALRPPFEEVREQYYSKLRDFVAFPIRFQGVGGSEFFAKLPSRNESSLLSVSVHSSQLFEKVEAAVRRFDSMLLLGRCALNGEGPTLDEIVGASLTEVQHWEASFRLLKQKGKEINQVDTFIKTDCITLSTAGVRAAVEEQLSKLAEALNSTLRTSAAKHLDVISAFLNESQSSLDTQFTKVEDLNRASIVNAELSEKRPKYEGEFHNFNAKNRLYMSLTNSSGIAHKEVKARWELLTKRLDDFEKEMDKRMGELKANVGSSLAEFWKTFEKFQAQWETLKPKDPATPNGSKFVSERKTQLDSIVERCGELRAQCKYFELDEPDFLPVTEVQEDVNAFDQMWRLMDEFNTDIDTCRKEPWMGFRSKIFKFEELLKSWTDKLREVSPTPISLHVRTLLDQWGRAVPLLKFVRGDGFTPNHWVELFRLLRITTNALGANITNDTLEFGHIIEHADDLITNEKPIKVLHARAQGEAQIREALDDIRAWGNTSTFKLVPHPDRANIHLITDWKDTITQLNDNQSLLISVKESPFFRPFADDAAQWEKKLSTLDEYLITLNQIQRKWVYLQPIFARGALPQEQPRFDRIDKEFLAIFAGIKKDPLVLSFAAHTEYKDKLKGGLEQLDRCQKALNDFLEQKRDRFPRFYFISDDDLLEILGQSRNVHVIQTHLKKLFMGINKVQFDETEKFIVKVASADGEIVPLLDRVEIKIEVEEWLSDLDRAMKATLQRSLIQCVDKLEVATYASQILCCAEQIHFATSTEVAIKEGATAPGGASASLKTHKANLSKQLRELTTFAATNSDYVLDLKLKALIMDIIHYVEVAELLVTNNVTRLEDWWWRKQLRFYLDRGADCVCQMVDADLRYSYEYQGNALKLVHTPLTDKAYMTVTQGLKVSNFSNLYGPAGTGKTESVKALANLLGRMCLVFNCDEGIDFKSIGRIFVGLVKSGAWGCFDEFNRLKVDQLSAISQMIQIIGETLLNKETHCQLLGRKIDVSPNAGIFVTLNPAGKHYGGRSKLPDNLKQLFRAVSMAAPDIELITENMLFSDGFENASALAKKVVAVFKLSKQLLSAQQHYDWGLRALKAVLRLAGKLVAAHLKECAAQNTRPDAAESLKIESEILIKSLRVNTLSKLTFDDVKLFNGLVTDVFPDSQITEIQYGDLKPAIVDTIKEMKLQVVPSQIDKILQLYEALGQRMGVVLVGPSGSGKSTALKILKGALQKMGQKIKTHTMNPKAMPREQLLGRMDNDTREWFDGVLTQASKNVVKEELTVRSWIICDGDIDPEWVESLNSVLDDNKLLTMPNGVRVQFANNVNFVFETHSLQFASPATVSRMGMIFLSEEDVDPKNHISSWLDEQPAELRDRLKGWIDEHFLKAVQLIEDSKASIVETTRMGLVLSGLSQLYGCNNKSQFATALVFGLGSYLPENLRGDFAKDIFHMCGERVPDAKRPLDVYYSRDRGALAMMQYESSFDLTIDELQNGPMIKTVDTQRAMMIMDQWVNGPTLRPFIIVGPEGAGKSMLLKHCFANVSNAKIATINCNAQTSATHVIRKLQQSCQLFNTNSGRVLRPKEADRLVLILKDLNLPKPDKYATVQLHSFLQQLILYQGFYDSDLEWVAVERLQIVGSMNPPGTSGRYPVAARFVAIVSVLCLSYPSKEALNTVYSDFFNTLLQAPVMQQIAVGATGKSGADFARVLVQLYDSVYTKFTVDVASHYVFNPRDVTRWVLSVLNYAPGGPNLLDILYHEGLRIFGDRIVELEERNKFERLLQDQFASLGWQKPAAAKDAPEGKDKKSSSSSSGAASEPMFVSWLDSSGGKTSRLSLSKSDDVKKATEKMMQSYARENPELDVILIPEIMQWLARIDRILAQPGGCPLVIARSGVGAGQMIRLASYLLRLQLFTLNITRGYSMKAFKIDLKAAVVEAGINGGNCVLFLEDHMFVDTAFLEMINSLLASGEIPGLFTPEELDPQLAPLKEEALSEGFTDGVYAYFANRVQKNLHIAIAMDATHPEYEARCRANPALFTRCSICWVGGWTAEGMKHIPKHFLKDILKSIEKDASSSSESSKFAKEFIQLHSRHNDGNCSPLQLQTLLLTYREIYKSKSTASDEKLAKLKGGLAKLAEAEQNVDSISKDVSEKKVEMEEKQKDADAALIKIQEKMEESAEQKKQIQKIQVELDADRAKVNEKKAVVEGRLATIQPLIDQAQSAVKGIQSGHLAEMKGFRTAPAAVVDVLDVVMVLLGVSNGGSDWAEVKKLFAETGTRPLLEYDPKSMNKDIRKKVEKMIAAKANSFKPEVISKASRACEPMAAWVKAVVEFSNVFEQVEPMHVEMNEFQKSLDKSQAKMEKYEEKLKKVEKKVEELRKNFESKTTEAVRLKDRLEKAENTLNAAQELLSKLNAEKGRWSKQAADIQRDMALVPKRALLAAAFMTYLGKEPEDKRRFHMQQWIQDLKVDSFNFFTFLRPESTMLLFKQQGLPSDELSMDNSIVILDQARTPLVIDPAGQAVEWLKNNLKSREIGVETCNPADERFMATLERCMRFGKTLLVIEVDRIDPVMYPIFRREFRQDGTKRIVILGDKTVEYGDSFQLYLFTRSTDLRLTPEIADYLTETSFTVTRSGLEGQLLGITIQREQPTLEEQKLSILKSEEGLKMQLTDLEETLLADLSKAEGSLLENKTLIDSLNRIKTQAQEIEDSLRKSKEVSDQIDAKREVYRPLAHRGSTILFLIRDLKALNHMYQFSLATFLELFDRAFEAVPKDHDDIETKIKHLGVKLQQLCVVAISRALFKADRVTFGVHLARGLSSETEVTENEFNFFLDKFVGPEGKQESAPSWVPRDALTSFKNLRQAFPDMVRNLNLHETDSWYQWMRSSTPETDNPTFLSRASAFQRLLVVKALRPDRLIAAMNQWACNVLSVPSLSDSASISAMIPLTSNSRPVLFLTSPGADPSMELQQTAYEIVGRDKYQQIAMGGGQTDEAFVMLKKAAEEGNWVCLKNLHLVIGWVPNLEAQLNLLKPHDNFRLFLTSEPHDSFPSILLSQSFKVTFEAPPGIKQNLYRTYGLWPDEFLHKQSSLQGQLLFSLSVLHATILERRSYVPQGWAKTYEFSQADLKSAADVILAQSSGSNVKGPDGQPQIDWMSIHGILENAIYGGRMETDFDVRILRKYLAHFLCDEALPTSRAQHFLTNGVKIPATTANKDFVETASRLPDNDIPSMFRLPPNADRVVQTARVVTAIADLTKLTQSRETSKMSREEWIAAITPILDTWIQVCQPHHELLSSQGAGKRDPQPINGFVAAEVDNSITLVRLVDSTMSDLRKVTEGTLLLSEQLRNDSYAMIRGDVPLAWDGNFVGPEQIIPWLKVLIKKAAAIRSWFTNIQNNSTGSNSSPLLRSQLDLSDLFRPQTFLNALRQETARNTREPLVSLELMSSLHNPPAGVAVYVKLSGVLLQGATIDGEHLSEINDSDAAVTTQVPDLYIAYVPKKEGNDNNNNNKKESVVDVPIYTNLSKESLLCELKLKCASEVDVKKYILSGTCLFLEP